MSLPMLRLLPALLVATSLLGGLATHPLHGAVIAGDGAHDARPVVLAADWVELGDGELRYIDAGREVSIENATGDALAVLWFVHGRQVHVATDVAPGATVSSETAPPRFWLGEDDDERLGALHLALLQAGVADDDVRDALAPWSDGLGPVPTWVALGVRERADVVEVVVLR